MIIRVVGFIGCLFLSMCLTGCGPELSERDLGTVVDKVPKVSGADKPYEMPRLGPTTENKEPEHR